MTTVVLDTNIWIYLTSDSYFELWQKLKEMKENKEINIVVNDIILLEWERNRETTIKNLVDNIKREYRSAKNLASYLPSDAKNAFLKSISEYQEEKNRIKMAENRVKEVETFMHSCSMFKVTNDQKLFVSELAINKVPPFQNNKNNFNDALIIRNVSEGIKQTDYNKYDLIFVSNNPDDFIDKSSKQPYPELFKGLENIKLKTVTELGEALKLAPELFDGFDEWVESQIEAEALSAWEISRGK